MNTTGVSSESAFLEEPNRNFIELGGGGGPCSVMSYDSPSWQIRALTI